MMKNASKIKTIISPLLLSCFVLSIATVGCLILFNPNTSYAETFTLGTALNSNDRGIQQMNNDLLDEELLAYQQLEYEQKLADVSFILSQYEMMDLQTFNFVIEISEHEQLKQLMLDSLQTMLTDFTTMNPDIHVSWAADPSDGLKLLVKLDIERTDYMAASNFYI